MARPVPPQVVVRHGENIFQSHVQNLDVAFSFYKSISFKSAGIRKNLSPSFAPPSSLSPSPSLSLSLFLSLSLSLDQRSHCCPS